MEEREKQALRCVAFEIWVWAVGALCSPVLGWGSRRNRLAAVESDEMSIGRSNASITRHNPLDINKRNEGYQRVE
jgi:hypothetical protein